MNQKSSRRGASKGSPVRGGKRPQVTGKQPSHLAKQRAAAASAAAKAAAKAAPKTAPVLLPTLRLGFVRGVAPSKWAERWARSVREQPLELVPVDLRDVADARLDCDVLLERVAPGDLPVGSDAAQRSRHAMHLYDETIALVVAADHELAKEGEICLEELALVTLLAHPDHFDSWPSPEPWADASWMPKHAQATLELVATGVGCALMAQPLARHLSDKRQHAVIPVSQASVSLLAGTGIWASWRVERDDVDVQRLVGVLRGRTARSSR